MLNAFIQLLLSEPWRKFHRGPHFLKKLRCDKCTKIQFKNEFFINKTFVVVNKAEVAFLLLILPEDWPETLPELLEDLLFPLHSSFPCLFCKFLTVICFPVIVPVSVKEKGQKASLSGYLVTNCNTDVEQAAKVREKLHFQTLLLSSYCETIP